MKNFLKYIVSMLVGNIGLTFLLWIPVVNFCTIAEGMPTMQEFFLIYAMIYIMMFILLVFELRPYSEWKEADEIEQLKSYAEEYRKPPYGKEIDGTPDLLEKAASSLQEAKDSITKLENRFVNGMSVHYQGDDADDGIECPMCGYEVARNDDYSDMKPKHCPRCGTKLIY